MKNEVMDILKKLRNKLQFVTVARILARCKKAGVQPQDTIYEIEGKKYLILEDDTEKVVISEDYNYVFSKVTGQFARWGRTMEEDPTYSPIGPEIADVEISVNGCSGGCSFCSPAGTKINTPNGAEAIEDIKIGDFVIGFDLSNNTPKIQEVAETYKRHYRGELICIELDSGETLRLTPDHVVILDGGVEVPAASLIGTEKIISF